MRDAGARSLDKFKVGFVNVDAVRKQWSRVEYAALVQVSNRRNTGGLPFNPALLQTVSKWAATFG